MVQTDAAAAVGVCRRRGLGKIRHLAVADLWIQDRLRAKDFQLKRIAGIDNTSDILTKHVDKRTLDKHIEALNLRLEGGRAESAPVVDDM